MKCPMCQSENPEGRKYCAECGAKLEVLCPHCQSSNAPLQVLRRNCGQKLDAPPVKDKPIPSTDSERKHVTALFSDVSGYTAMTEKLDPEEVKEIMGKIFGEISGVVARYDGFIEKFIGDAVMALFGATVAHEDDPVRAIKAAREIHDIVSSISPRYEDRIGKPLAMHTRICTGLVVTGDVNLEKGTHGVLGDTINTAARLSSLAKPGEIVISSETYSQAEGYFTFEPMEATAVKGKSGLVKPYRVLSSREKPTETHRISGLRAELIGRKVEIAQLRAALQNLKQGKVFIFSIVGDAGTGKRRLIQEFRANLSSRDIQWREGHDLDGDGDLDIVSSVFIPALDPTWPNVQYVETIVWLSQTAPGQFERFRLENGYARHPCLDVGDLDGDGDPDIVLGNFVFYDRTGEAPTPSLIVLENQSRRPTPQN